MMLIICTASKKLPFMLDSYSSERYEYSYEFKNEILCIINFLFLFTNCFSFILSVKGSNVN